MTGRASSHAGEAFEISKERRSTRSEKGRRECKQAVQKTGKPCGQTACRRCSPTACKQCKQREGEYCFFAYQINNDFKDTDYPRQQDSGEAPGPSHCSGAETGTALPGARVLTPINRLEQTGTLCPRIPFLGMCPKEGESGRNPRMESTGCSWQHDLDPQSSPQPLLSNGGASMRVARAVKYHAAIRSH